MEKSLPPARPLLKEGLSGLLHLLTLFTRCGSHWLLKNISGGSHATLFSALHLQCLWWDRSLAYSERDFYYCLGIFFSLRFSLTAIKHLNMQHNSLWNGFSFAKSILILRSCLLQEAPFGKHYSFPYVMLLW